MSKNNIVVEKKETSVIAEVTSSKTVEITVPGHAASEFTQAIERLGEVERTAGEAKTSAEKSAGLANDAKAEAERLAREAGDYAGDAQGLAKSAGDFARAANQSAINAGKALTGANEAKTEALKAQEATAKDAEKTGKDAIKTGKDAEQTNADLQRLLTELANYLPTVNPRVQGSLYTPGVTFGQVGHCYTEDASYGKSVVLYARHSETGGISSGVYFFTDDSPASPGTFSFVSMYGTLTSGIDGSLLWRSDQVLTTSSQVISREAQTIVCENIGAVRVLAKGNFKTNAVASGASTTITVTYNSPLGAGYDRAVPIIFANVGWTSPTSLQGCIWEVEKKTLQSMTLKLTYLGSGSLGTVNWAITILG